MRALYVFTLTPLLQALLLHSSYSCGWLAIDSPISCPPPPLSPAPPGPEDIIKENLKLVLGLVWTLILRYQLGIGSEPPEPGTKPTVTSGAKKVLLGWIQATLPQQNVHNFTTDWRDGRNLSALVDRMKPGLIPDHATLDPNKRLENTKKAMDLAEEVLGVPQVMKPENLAVEKPDELSVITYLSYYCNKESPGKDALLKWIQSKIPDHNISNFTSDWRSGQALAALTDVISGGNFPEAEEMNPDTALENAQKSMDYAESHLGVPKVISPEEFVDPSLDALPMMTYLTQFQNAQAKDFSADVITVTGPGITGGMAGQETNFIVKGRIPRWANLAVTVTSPTGGHINVQQHSPAHRMVKCTYTPVVPGNYKVEVTVNNDHVPHSPFVPHHIKPSDANSCYADGEGLEKARVGEKAQFSVNCERGGPGNLQVEINGPGGNVEAEMTEEEPLEYLVSYNPSTPGEHTLAVLWAGKHINGSPFKCPVSDPKRCSASGKGLTEPCVDKVNTFKVETHSAGPGTLQVNIADPSGSPVPVDVQHNDMGTYTCNYTPTSKGEHTINLTWAGGAIPGSPFHIQPRDTLDPRKCKARNLPTGFLRASYEATFIVDTKGAGEGELKVTGHGPNDVVNCLIRKDGRTSYTVAFTPFEVGQTSVDVTFANESIPNSPFLFMVNDPTKCRVNMADLGGEHFVNEPIEFPVSTEFAGEGDLTAEVTGPKGENPVELKDQKDGSYLLQFTPTDPGLHSIDIFFDGDQIPDAPVRISAIVDVPNVIVTEPLPGRLNAFIVETPYVYKVNASDARDGKLTATCHGSRLGAQPKVTITDLGDKQYTVALEADVPDDYQVFIKWRDDPVPFSPFFLPIQDKPRPERVRVSGPYYEVGSPTVTALVDATQAGSGEPSAVCSGKSFGPIEVSITKEDTKKYKVSFEGPPDECTLDILWSDEQVPGSPFFIDLVPPDATKVRMSGPEYSIGSPTVIATVDASQAGNGEMSAFCHGKTTGTIQVEVREKGKRVFFLEFQAPELDEVSLEIMWSGSHIPHSPFNFDLRPSEADKVLVRGPHYKVGSPDITAEVDTSKAGAGELSATLSGENSGLLLPVSVNQEADQQYKLAMEATESDEYKLSIFWSERHVPGSPFYMDMRKPDASKVCIIEPTSYEVDLPVVYKVDASKAGVGELDATCHYGRFGSLPVDIVTVDQDTQQYEVAVIPKEPVDYNLSIRWSDDHVPKSPFLIHLLPDVVPENVVCSDVESSIVDQPVFLTADTSKAGPGKLTASCTGKESGEVPVSVDEIQPSIHKVSFIPSQEDDYSLAVYFDDQPVPKSPFEVGIHPVNETIDVVHMEDEIVLETTPPPSGPPPELDMLIGDPLEITLDAPATSDGMGAIEAKATGDTVGPTRVNILKDGQSSMVVFNPTQPDRYFIDVKVDDKHIPDSPIIVNYRRLFDSSKCFITDLPYSSAPPIVEEDINFSVDATQAGKAELVVVSDGPSGKEPSHQVVTEEPHRLGYYRVKYIPMAAGQHRINLTYGGDTVPGSPLLFTVAGGSPISGLHVYTFGQPVHLKLNAECKKRHIKSFAIQESTSNRLELRVAADKEKHKFHLTFTPHEPDFYEVHVLISGVRVAGCPYRIQYLEPPNPEKVAVDITPSNIAYIHEPIQFNIDAKEGGNAELLLRASVRRNRPEDFDIVNNGDGTYSGSYIPKVAGSHSFDVLWNNKPVTGSPFLVSVVRRPPEVSHLLTQNLNLIEVGKTIDVYFSLANADDRDSVATRATGKVVGETNWKLQALEDEKKFRAHFSSATPDDYVLEIKFQDVLIEGSPFHVKVVGLGALEPSRSINEVDVPSIVDVGEPVNFLLKTDLEDVPPSDLAVNIDGPDDLSPVPSVKGDLQGMYAINFTPEEVGDYLVHVKRDSIPVTSSPFRITAQQVKGIPENCYVVPEDLPLFAKTHRFGNPCKFRVSTADAGRGTLNITSRGPGKAEVKIFDEGEGIYSCELTPAVAGNYLVDINWDDQPIKDSPYHLSFKHKKKRVITGLNLESEHFLIGVPHRFKLHCDELGTGILEVKCRPPSCARIHVIVADKDSYQIELMPVDEGHHEVSVQYNGNHISGSPFNVTFYRKQKGDATKCRMEKSEVEQNDKGEDIVVFIVTTEGAGPGQLTANVENVHGDVSPDVDVKKMDEEFKYKVEFLLGEGTEYVLNIKYDDEHIDGSPFKLLFDPKPNPEACRAEGDGLKSSLVGKEAEFTVSTEGAGQGELKVTIEGDDGTSIEPDLTKSSEDQYRCTYTPAQPGDYSITVKWGDLAIPDSPFHMKCHEPPSKSTTLKVIDPPSNIVLGKPIVFMVKNADEVEEKGEILVSGDSGAGNIDGTVFYEGFGAYRCTLEPRDYGKFTVRVTWNGENINGSPFKVKVGHPPRPDLVKAYGPGLEDGFIGQEGNFTLETGEAGSGTLAVRVHGPKGAFKINMRHHPDEERTILVRYDPKYVGEYTIDVTWSEQHIPNSPFKVNIREQMDSKGDEKSTEEEEKPMAGDDD